MYSIYDQINNRKVLIYPERTTVESKTTDSVVLTNEQIASTYFPEDIDVKPEIYFDKVEIGEGNYIYNGDNIEVLRTLPDNSVDSVVTDPPYGLKFMGKQWDYDVPSVELWKECYRVLKPGGYLLSFGSSRTYHRMAVKVEDAGFEIRDQIMWVYGSGFPKSHNIGKAVDKINGTQREVIGKNPNHRKSSALYELGFQGGMGNGHITKGFNEWEGFGTALKPAHEPIVMARKPFKGSVAKNVLKWTTGGINIDDCRIEFEETKNPATNPLYRQENDYKMPKKGEESNGVVSFTSSKNKISSLGRFPANIIFDEEAGMVLDEQSGITSQGHWSKTKITGFGKFGNGKTIYKGIGKKDELKGGASRFFYCPKPSRKEKEDGLTGEPIQIKGRDDGQDNRNVPQKLRKTNRKNTHTTVKPLKLMQYLIRLVTPKGGVTIDPYFGSGSSGKSTIREGNYKFIGIEKEKEYFNIAVERCQFEYEQSLKVAA
jgi:site-specific DNA-methyltransferase (adenine-specific)